MKLGKKAYNNYSKSFVFQNNYSGKPIYKFISAFFQKEFWSYTGVNAVNNKRFKAMTYAKSTHISENIERLLEPICSEIQLELAYKNTLICRPHKTAYIEKRLKNDRLDLLGANGHWSIKSKNIIVWSLSLNGTLPKLSKCWNRRQKILGWIVNFGILKTATPVAKSIFKNPHTKINK